MLNLILAAVLSAQGPAPSDPVDAPVFLRSHPGPLAGSLMTPDGETRAAAVIIPGSGPTDRNGDNPVGVRGGVLRQLAQGLAERGVATVRIDKRGIAGSAFAAKSESELSITDLIDDVRAWAALAVERTGQPCVWLIGHSEGALIAQAAAAGNSEVCGLVLLSPVGQPAGRQIREQLSHAPEPLRTRAMEILAELEAGRTTGAPPELAMLFRPSVQPYLISYFALDPAALIADYDRPVMLGHGTTDIQVPPTNAEALAAVRPEAHLVLFEGVNHVLRVAPPEPAANAAAYGDATLPLAPGLAGAVADFILESR